MMTATVRHVRRSRFTSIAVDWRVLAADKRRYDVIFVGTEDGRLLKLINTSRGRYQLLPVVIEVIGVFSQPIVHIHIDGPSASRRQSRDGRQDDANDGRGNTVEQKEKVLVVASRIDIVLLSLERCQSKTSCSECVALRDPYCSWLSSGQCAHSRHGYQNINTGQHAKCRLYDVVTGSSTRSQAASKAAAAAESQEPTDTTAANISSHISGPCYTETWKAVGVGKDTMYSAETIAVASTICILVSLSAGCSLGFLVAAYRRSAVRDLANRTRRSPCHWTPDKDGTEVVSNGVTNVPLARLYAVFGSRHGTVTSQTSDGSNSRRATLHKACQTAVDGGSSKSTPTRRRPSAYRRANLSYSPNSSAVYVSNYARRPSAMS